MSTAKLSLGHHGARQGMHTSLKGHADFVTQQDHVWACRQPAQGSRFLCQHNSERKEASTLQWPSF